MKEGNATLFVDGGEQEIVVSYMEHTSLAYGTDWCRMTIKDLPTKSYDGVQSTSKEEQATLKCSDTVNVTSDTVDITKSIPVDFSRDTTLVGSCSFYDHVLHLWNYTNKE